MTAIEFDSTQVLLALQRVHGAVDNMRPALAAIGESWAESTKLRFASSTAPDGSHWLLNTPATLEHKEGDKPLVDHGTLGEFIIYHATRTDLEVGSYMEYAAMMQFGGTKEEFPHLWGDVPAREFLGVSNEDIAEALEIMERFLGF